MPAPNFEVLFAKTAEDLSAVQALRYSVFVQELGGDGALVDHENGLERDPFDPHSQHMMLLDRARGKGVSEQLVGVYRLMDQSAAQRAGGFYSAQEFDLAPLLSG